MINHLRTLLLNQTGNTGQGPDFPGAEYVPPDYRARPLPPYLVVAQQALFGTNPSPLYRNYWLWQIMQLLHSTELEEYVLALDSRVTYLRDGAPFFTGVFGTAVTQSAGDTAALYVAGADAVAPGGVWTVDVADGIARVVREQPPQTDETSLTFVRGLSQPVPLSGSGLTVRCHEDATASWRVTSAARPTQNLGDLLAQLTHAMAPYLLTLFGASPVEPFRTFQQVYQLHPLAPYKYGALLLALAYRIDALSSTGAA